MLPRLQRSAALKVATGALVGSVLVAKRPKTLLGQRSIFVSSQVGLLMSGIPPARSRQSLFHRSLTGSATL